MERALVLGGETGLLGQSIVKVLVESNWHVDTLGRKDGDIFQERFFTKQIEEKNPDVVFNTIAWTQVDDAEDHEEEARHINADFPKMIASILAKSKIHLIHFSTDFVFSGKHNAPLKEDDTPKPESVYGATKRMGETAVQEILPTQAAILRTAWLFGPKKKNFVQTILTAAKTKPELTVVSDQIGSPTYTPDLAAFSFALARARQSGIWHTVNAGSASWYELAKKALEFAHSTCRVKPIASSQWPQKAKRPSYSVLSCDKLASFLQKPIRSWEDALFEYVQGLHL